MGVWGRVRAWLRGPWLAETRRSAVAVVAVLPVLGFRIATAPDDADGTIARTIDDGIDALQQTG